VIELDFSKPVVSDIEMAVAIPL